MHRRTGQAIALAASATPAPQRQWGDTSDQADDYACRQVSASTLKLQLVTLAGDASFAVPALTGRPKRTGRLLFEFDDASFNFHADTPMKGPMLKLASTMPARNG